MIGLVRKVTASLQPSVGRRDRAAAGSGEGSRLWHDIARALDECAAAAAGRDRTKSGANVKGGRR